MFEGGNVVIKQEKLETESDVDTKIFQQPQPVPTSVPGSSVAIKQDPSESDSSESESSSSSSSSKSSSSSSSGDDFDDYEAVENFQVDRFVFCQRCGNLLTVDTDEGLKCHRFVCSTCPFYLNITKRIVLSAEKVEDIDDQEEAIHNPKKSNELRQKTEVLCPECMNKEAYFYQVQTRSADEPMTNFYQCTTCKHNWRD